MIHISHDNVFHLSTRNTSYIFRARPEGQLESLYYGALIPPEHDYTWLFQDFGAAYGCAVSYSRENPAYSLDHLRMEFSAYGKGDYRRPMLEIRGADGGFCTDFLFDGAKIEAQKPPLPGLPQARGGKQALIVSLKDPVRGIIVRLCYCPYEDCDVITRSVEINNISNEPVTLTRVMSYQLDLPDRGQSMLTFDGAWARERRRSEKKLSPGAFCIGSTTGTSSNRHNPFYIIAQSGCWEDAGECYGFNLIYSGNHEACAEVSPGGTLRLGAGINPFAFAWKLRPGESFYAPEAAFSFSRSGYNGLSRNMGAFVNRHIVPPRWRGAPRPILANSWEACYFDFDEEKLVRLAEAAVELGVELFVLDDGWFGKRNDDTSSLGDWTVNREKLPGGLSGLAEKISALGLQFGLWVEPEMVCPDSGLYRAHPDWAIHAPGYTPTQGRNQLVLDLTREDVTDYLIRVMSELFESAHIEYVKWDMNRTFTDVYAHDGRHGEFFHRYVLGLYRVFEKLTQSFPDILFEGCSSGGNRFDLGMLYYMPQIWTSDDSDAVERLAIQRGTSYGYPPSAMGAHVSPSPNHQVLRMSSIEERFNVAAFGVLGYELDLRTLSERDKNAVRAQTAFYKKYRAVLQYGDFYRLFCDGQGNKQAWMSVSADKKDAVLGFYQNRAQPNPAPDTVRPVGLDEALIYEVSVRVQYHSEQMLAGAPGGGHGLPELTESHCFTASGLALMNAGIVLKQAATNMQPIDKTRLMTDNDSRIIVFKAM